MNTTAESAFLASSFLGIRLQGARLPAQPAQLASVDLQALQASNSTTPPPHPKQGHRQAPSHSELSSNVTSSRRPSLTTLYELAHLLEVSPCHSVEFSSYHLSLAGGVICFLIIMFVSSPASPPPECEPGEGRDFLWFTVASWGRELCLGHSRRSVNKSNELNPCRWPLSLELDLESLL